MKIVKTASGKVLKISKSEWMQLGKGAGWTTTAVDDTWMQKAVPEKNEGKFGTWCKSNGFESVCQGCIDKAISAGGHAAKMANFAINASDKYSHPSK